MTLLDSLWLAGSSFYQLLEQLIAPLNPYRSVNVKFEYTYGLSGIPLDHDVSPVDEGFIVEGVSEPPVGEEFVNEDVNEPPVGEETREDRWAVSFIEKAHRLSVNLRQYREIDPHWSAIKMLRIPASRQGGFDLWNWGKMTYRASSFREGNNYLRYIARVYEQATRAIEDAV